MQTKCFLILLRTLSAFEKERLKNGEIWVEPGKEGAIDMFLSQLGISIQKLQSPPENIRSN